METTETGLLRRCATMADHLRRYLTDAEIRTLQRIERPDEMVGRNGGIHAPRGKTALGRLRVAAGLTQFAASVRIGVHDTEISHWETGDRSVSLARCHQLADLYGCPLADVLAAVAGDGAVAA